MKRYIFDEVATREEATKDDSYPMHDFRYGIWLHDNGCMNGSITSASKRIRSGTFQWLKLTVLEGEPEAVAEATRLIGQRGLTNLVEDFR